MNACPKWTNPKCKDVRCSAAGNKQYSKYLGANSRSNDSPFNRADGGVQEQCFGTWQETIKDANFLVYGTCVRNKKQIIL